MNYAIGIDLGGTDLRAALVTRDTGEVLRHDRVRTDHVGGPAAVIAQMVALVAHVRQGFPDSELLGVGVGSPGPLNSDEGIVMTPPNLPGWYNVPLRALLADRLGLRVELGNDANVAALGEWRFGSGRGTRHFIYVTISTGIGGGIIVDRQLLLGRGGFAAEVGHMSIAAQGPVCACGHVGCWEALASGTTLAKFATIAIAEGRPTLITTIGDNRPVSAHQVAQAAERGDSLALELMQNEARYLAVGLVNLMHLFSPERIALGGGVMESFALLETELRSQVNRLAMEGYRSAEIVLAQLGSHTGVIGAAVLVM